MEWFLHFFIISSFANYFFICSSFLHFFFISSFLYFFFISPFLLYFFISSFLLYFIASSFFHRFFFISSLLLYFFISSFFLYFFFNSPCVQQRPSCEIRRTKIPYTWIHRAESDQKGGSSFIRVSSSNVVLVGPLVWTVRVGEDAVLSPSTTHNSITSAIRAHL